MALQQSNLAAGMIEGGHYTKAIKMLKELLCNTKEHFEGEMASGLRCETKDTTLQQLILQSVKGHHGPGESMAYSTYNQAVYIPLHVAAITDNAVAVVSSIIMLNLAFAFHLSGNETDDETLRDSYLSKAFSLYRLV